MIKIRRMEQSDIAFAKSLTDIEGWGHLEEDFERFLFLNPAGSYVAWHDGERVGIITSVCYGDYSFLGNLIVRKEVRGRGVGVQLMKSVLEHLDRMGMKTIELDGVFKAVQTYRIFGFKDKYLSLRFLRPASEIRFKTKKDGNDYAEDIDKIIRFDRERTGIDRGKFIKHLIKMHKHTTYVKYGQGIAAYAVIRERATGVLHIGPMIAESGDAANELIGTICMRHGNSDLTAGVPCINTVALKVFTENGFLHRPPSVRMYRGLRAEYEHNMYTIVSADAG